MSCYNLTGMILQIENSREGFKPEWAVTLPLTAVALAVFGC
jgi:hypothetical protein